ncbi:FolM Alternative dihydrofolate reductase 1 [Paramagnetospirillum magnetotacticum MS-1]|uniref:FolM Alternative dihydrofolate reductase 1 n=1 Tax=Paramagnetospirillum magnetotacticum MS-1 TaxID=272627 RepID=A0A0C2YPZ9_PARME|nr:SDR family oxidoreductase [Paramagnetospirillum magnetotacticum]KIL97188.1 FolM Alternative dihydrofolate reductase 1 [Paramagnetospirillum magnetotacticum MS-1]
MTESGPSPLLPRSALVTGAGRRIGREVALDLARQGFAVAVHYHHSAEEALAVVAEITQAGGRAVAVAADLACEEQVAALVAASEAAVGPLGLLVNNASVFERDDALGATRASWDLHMEVNLRAPFVLTQEFAKGLPDGAEGLVVNLLDQRVWSLTPHFTSYTLSKAALWAATQTLALALAPRIRVVGIGPGPALPSVRQTEAQFAAQVAQLPLARGTSPGEVCRTLRFLLATPSITGQMIALDGGQHLGWAWDANVPDE